ncbi:MAG: HupE/UreJ family protein [Pseudomonadota bacterium]
MSSRFQRPIASCTDFSAPFVLVLLSLATHSTHAHVVGQSYLYLQITQTAITGRAEIGLVDFNTALALTGTDREITERNVNEYSEFLQNYYLEKVTISAQGKELPIRFEGREAPTVRFGYLQLPFDITGYDSLPTELSFDYSLLFDEDPEHDGFVLVESNWATGVFANESGISLAFQPDRRKGSLSVVSNNRWRGFVAVFLLGLEHIWEGVDHILFLLGLLVPAVMLRRARAWEPIEHFRPAFLNVLKIVTAFTVAHSFTLSLAALNVIELPSRLVEIIIAASITIVAVDILFPIFRVRVWPVVLLFGLFHGFGFAGALSEMGVFGEFVLLPLLAFNLGVEVGQLTIVAIVFPILFLLRSPELYRKVFMPAGAVFLLVISLAWVAERSLAIDLPIGELPGLLIEHFRW